MIRRHDPNGAWIAGRGWGDGWSASVRFWFVDGSERSAISVCRLGDGRLRFDLGSGPFTATLPGLEALRKVDDATDGYLMEELGRSSRSAAIWLREMIHRDRGKPDDPDV